jgi:hypothetical protein
LAAQKGKGETKGPAQYHACPYDASDGASDKLVGQGDDGVPPLCHLCENARVTMAFSLFFSF